MTSFIHTSLYTLRYISFISLVIVISGCATATDIKAENPVFPPPPDEARFYYERTIVSSADVEPDQSGDSFKRLVTGAKKIGAGMSKPFGVAVHRGRVFVGDSAAAAVHVFDYPEQKYFVLGNKRPGKLRHPLGIDVDGLGNLFVVDSGLKEVLMFNREGEFIKSIGNSEIFSRPSGVAVTKDGKFAYVVDTGGVDSDKHQVAVFDVTTGELVKTISRRGSEAGELNLPRDAVVGADGLLYVVDGGNFRVQAFNRENGQYVKQFGKVGRLTGQFSRPKAISVDKDGNLYVVDTAFGNFQIFNQQGQLLLGVGSRGGAHQPAVFMLPAGLTVDEDGRVYMVDQYFKKVEVFRPATLEENTGFLSTKKQSD